MKIGWGVIGAGGIARRRTIPEGIVPAKNARLVAVMDVAETLAKEVGAQFGVPACCCVDELLASKGVEAVYIASPANAHKEAFLKAIKAGKHVLVEKPLAHTLKDAQAMVAAAAKAKKLKCAEGYMMKFHPLHQKAKELVAGGKIGKPVFVRGQLSCWYPPIKGAWRQDPVQGGGGSLIDMATHIYDLMQYVLGSDIVEVSAMCDTLAHGYKVEDSATTLLKFANGCHGVVDTFFSVPDAVCERMIEIMGTAGAIMGKGTIGQGGGTMRACCLGAVGGYDAAQKREAAQGFKELKPGKFNMYKSEVEALSQAIIDGKPVEMNTLEEGLKILKIAQAAYKSAKTGKRVAV